MPATTITGRSRGCEGWSYAELLPYFKRAERHEKGADDYRGGDGPLPSRRRAEPRRWPRPSSGAGVEAGYPYTPDANGRQQEGFGPMDRTTRDGRRWSVARGYLAPAASRPEPHHRHRRAGSAILLEGRRAVGVAYSVAGNELETRGPSAR